MNIVLILVKQDLSYVFEKKIQRILKEKYKYLSKEQFLHS